MLNSQTASPELVTQTGLDFRFYQPSNKPRGLLVLVHGRAGNKELMWIFSKIVQGLNPEDRPLIVTPQGFVPDIKDSFSWWPHHAKLSADATPELRRERLAEVLSGVTRLRDFILRVQELFEIPSGKTFAAGFSQGGANLGTVSLLDPKLLSGVALLSSFIPLDVMKERTHWHPQLQNAEILLPPFFLFHGSEDDIIPLERAEMTRDFLQPLSSSVDFSSDSVGHKVSSQGIRNLSSWFEHLYQAV